MDTYAAGMSDLKALIGMIQDDNLFGLHGFRVLGWERAKRAKGEGVATAHGLWKPGSTSRYDRFNLLRDIFPLASGMVNGPTGEGSESGDDEVAPRRVGGVEVRRRAASDSDDPLSQESDPESSAGEAGGEAGSSMAHVTVARRIAAMVSPAVASASLSPPSRSVTRRMARGE